MPSWPGFVEPDPTAAQVIAGLHATVEGGQDLVQVLTPEGVRIAEPRFDRYLGDVDVPRLQSLYRDMVLVRRFDREANSLQRQGQLGIWVPLLGQEAAQIGAGRAMAARDMAFPSYREHGVAWCRGIDPTELLGIFRGTDQGSWDPAETGFHLYTIVIGNQCLNARGYGFPGIRVDGNDVLATLAVTRWALEECRTGNGPVLIEAFTYRMDAHTTSDDPSRYRLADELELWKLKDPIERVRVNLVREHELGQDFFDEVAAESDALAARFREYCTNMPEPGPERMFSEVYAESSPVLDAQRDAFLAYHASFEGTS